MRIGNVIIVVTLAHAKLVGPNVLVAICHKVMPNSI